MKERKLLILLDEYPYQAGEYSFIKTELSKLIEAFDISILSTSSSSVQNMEVDERVKVYHFRWSFGFCEKIKAIFQYLFLIEGICELFRILKRGKNISQCIYESISYYGCAKQVQKYVNENDLVENSQNQIVYSYWMNSKCLAFLLHKHQYKVISRVHGYDLYNERNAAGRQPFREIINQRIDKVVFVAQTGQEYYAKHWKTDNSCKYQVLPIGCEGPETIDICVSNKGKGEFILVSCSSTIPLKRVDLIIKALEKVEIKQSFSVKWIHFGAGSELESLQEQAQAVLGQKNNLDFEFRGFVPVEEVLSFYKDTYVDCFITTSSTEGSPVSIQEAMAYGIPVIGTGVGEIPNMIQECGIVLNPSPQIQEISAAIEKMMYMAEQERNQLRIEARKKWEEMYDADKNTAQFLELLREL